MVEVIVCRCNAVMFAVVQSESFKDMMAWAGTYS